MLLKEIAHAIHARAAPTLMLGFVTQEEKLDPPLDDVSHCVTRS